MRTRFIAAGFLLLGLFVAVPLAAQQADSDVILQGFYWNTHPGDLSAAQGVWWDSVATVAPEIAGAGFKTVWTPPPSKGFAGVQDMGYGLYDYFDLGAFDQKGTVRTRHGTRAQLDAMIAALHGHGLRAMADVVLNHRGGAEGQQLEDCDDGDGRQLRFTEFRPASGRLPADAPDFHPNSFPGHCNLFGPFHNRIFFEDICYFNFLDPTLDPAAPADGWFFGPHNLGNMGDSLVVWGRYLIDEVGFDEVRLDAVKHIEPGFLAPFLVELANGPQPFAVGEFFDGNAGAVAFYQKDVERFVSTFGTGTKDADFAVFDFPLRFALRDMANDLGGGFNMWDLNFRGLLLDPNAGLAGEDIVTFVENHDTDRFGFEVVPCPGPIQFGSTCLDIRNAGGHDPVVFDKHMAYAYIMAAEGRPTVFWKDWFWFEPLDQDIEWLMALRRAFATGGTTTVQNLNPFSFDGLIGDDLFALRRDGTGTGEDGAMLMLNDDPSNTFSFFLDSPNGWANGEVRDYSDAFLFETSQVFADGRALYKSNPRTYAWYAPTGQYPQPPDAAPSSFTLGEHVGAKLHHVVLRAADAATLFVNGAPIEPGDEIAVLPPSGSDAVGLGRIGQRFQWDGVHDMVIEVLGGGNPAEARGGLLNGDALRLAVFDQSAGTTFEAFDVAFAPSGTNFDFNGLRPPSRPGPVNATTNTDSGAYQAGGLSLVTGFETVIQAVVDVKPGSDPSAVNPRSRGVIPLALLSTQTASGDPLTFDATTVAPLTVRFGPDGASEAHGRGHVEDADGDGDLDLVLHFRTRDTGIQCGDTEAPLTGQTFDGHLLDTSGALQTVGCGARKAEHDGEGTAEMPETYALDQNYPNPFNPETEIRFQLPQAGRVTLKVYNAVGEVVATLVDGFLDAGYHRARWSAANTSGQPVASGIYFYRLQAGDFAQVRTMSLVR